MGDLLSYVHRKETLHWKSCKDGMDRDLVELCDPILGYSAPHVRSGKSQVNQGAWCAAQLSMSNLRMACPQSAQLSSPQVQRPRRSRRSLGCARVTVYFCTTAALDSKGLPFSISVSLLSFRDRKLHAVAALCWRRQGRPGQRQQGTVSSRRLLLQKGPRRKLLLT